MRTYRFVGRKEFIPPPDALPPRSLIRSVADAGEWIGLHRDDIDGEGLIPATFIVDVDGQLWVADRRSEHVACARLGDVLAAGEMFFGWEEREAVVVRISNQSTGYCPEPESFPAVGAALTKAGLCHPEEFEPAFEFRRCPSCETICILKYDDDDCAVCGGSLPPAWNFEG